MHTVAWERLVGVAWPTEALGEMTPVRHRGFRVVDTAKPSSQDGHLSRVSKRFFGFQCRELVVIRFVSVRLVVI